MAIDSITPTGAPTVASAAKSQISADYESFLTLLTAQIQNQNPLEPMDSTTFVSQLAQLSQVEQAVQTNTNLEEIASQLAQAGALSGVQMLGREVSTATEALVLEDGTATYDYRLAAPAAQVTARILSSDGTLLRELTDLATSAEDRHRIEWDGLDSEGLPVVGSGFTIKIDALDADGAAVGYAGFASGTVTGLTFAEGVPVLVLGDGTKIPASRVETVN
ncbi:flagellar hook assembly protein FlgD [Pseudoroseicyclus aestuarii]|uniref:Basal-body rod modification protein FlgD n=1 Tax=Pseudoroseicyclus aestuarii TaxID=1795041 RepID=A0A318SX14_9RHOB|nr:flagellar hook assembly protein FlgD [Pseudoroseicyclus aestuarii]PYE84367.1 flagellar basal-body rod modification protein FlgD [Pseudoroseicyclus aestuarii]